MLPTPLRQTKEREDDNITFQLRHLVFIREDRRPIWRHLLVSTSFADTACRVRSLFEVSRRCQVVKAKSSPLCLADGPVFYMRGWSTLSSARLEVKPAGVSFATSRATVLFWRDDSSSHRRPLDAFWTVAAQGRSDPRRCIAPIFCYNVSLQFEQEFRCQFSQYDNDNNSNNTLSSA